jgi:alkylation response protein AidB-like acyl-CoA dehydrogenase
MNFDWTEFDGTLRKQLDLIPAQTGQGAQPDAAALLAGLAAAGYLDLTLTAASEQVNETGALETAARRWPDLFLAVEMSTRVFGRALARWGEATLRSEVLEALRRGQAVGAVALCEDHQNVQWAEIRTAGRNDQGQVRLSGSKSHVINVAAADHLAVVGRLEGRPALFLVPRGAPGLTLRGESATMAGPNVRFGAITLTDCPIPMGHVLIPADGEGMLEILRLWENQVLCAAALGDMGRAFDTAKVFAETHANAGKPIIAYQAVAFKLAEMFTLRQSAQLLAYHAGWRAATADRAALTLMTCAKVFCTEAAERIVSEAMQVLGVHGCAPDHDLMRAFGRSKFGSICGTSSEVARNTIGDVMMKYVK